MTRTLFLLSAAAAMATTAVLCAFPALGAEQRCTELGVNCVCSEPLNTTTLVFSNSWYNPGDSTTKECTREPFSVPDLNGFAITRQQGDAFGSNDPVVLGRLPKRTSALQYFLRVPDGYIGTVDVGHAQAYPPSRAVIDAATPGNMQAGARTEYISKARAAMRWYRYTSETFTFDGGNGGLCTNMKVGGIDEINATHGFEPNVQIGAYNFGWDLDSNGICAGAGLPANCGRFKLDGSSSMRFENDCCNPGPTISDFGPSDPAEYRGKWWMFEMVIQNRFGAGYQLQLYARNVSDNGPERVVIDTNGTLAGGGPWIPSANLTSNEINATGSFTALLTTAPYRAGTCLGFVGQSHFMVAQWDTNAGQRIGPAFEVEGGTGQPPGITPPAAPTNLRLTSLWDQVITLLWSLARLVG